MPPGADASACISNEKLLGTTRCRRFAVAIGLASPRRNPRPRQMPTSNSARLPMGASSTPEGIAMRRAVCSMTGMTNTRPGPEARPNAPKRKMTRGPQPMAMCIVVVWGRGEDRRMADGSLRTPRLVSTLGKSSNLKALKRRSQAHLQLQTIASLNGDGSSTPPHCATMPPWEKRRSPPNRTSTPAC